MAEEYCKAVKFHFGDRLRSVCFFGSVARGEATPGSDLDLLIIADRLSRDIGLRFRETNYIHEALRKTDAYRRLRANGRRAFISDIFLTPTEVQSHPPILLDVADHGVIMYDREGFLEVILRDIRLKLGELGARKIAAKKGYYWVLKPDAQVTEDVEI